MTNKAFFEIFNINPPEISFLSLCYRFSKREFMYNSKRYRYS